MGIGLTNIRNLGRLEVLRLNGTRVGEMGLVPLGELPSLHRLGLAGTLVNDSSIPAPARLTTLERLDVRECSLSEDGVEQLRKALPNTTIYSEGPRFQYRQPTQ